MADEQRGDSLAERAAAWVPPWARPAAEAPTTADAAADAEPAPVEPELRAVTVEPELRAVTVEPEAVAAGSELVEPAPVAAEPEPVEPEPVEPEPVEPEPAEPEPVEPEPVEPEPVEPVLAEADLRAAIEAIMLVVDEPVAEITLAQVLEQPVDRVGAMLTTLARDYTSAGHGFELRRAAGGWRLYTRAEYASYVERFVLDGQSVRLTQAALETLAVVAYKQPVTRSRISAIRGVNCDGTIRTLMARGLVQECGTETETGAHLYRTTPLFLEKLGVDSVAELPPLAPFLPDDVEEIADAAR